MLLTLCTSLVKSISLWTRVTISWKIFCYRTLENFQELDLAFTEMHQYPTDESGQSSPIVQETSRVDFSLLAVHIPDNVVISTATSRVHTCEQFLTRESKSDHLPKERSKILTKSHSEPATLDSSLEGNIFTRHHQSAK